MLKTLSLTPTLLLGEIHVGSTTLYITHFQSVIPAMILPNKRVSGRECPSNCAKFEFPVC